MSRCRDEATIASGKRLVIGHDYCSFVQVCKKQLELEFEIVSVAYDGLISEVRYQHTYVVKVMRLPPAAPG
jgi:hypothetical protein